jgi:hypothetical protein
MFHLLLHDPALEVVLKTIPEAAVVESAVAGISAATTTATPKTKQRSTTSAILELLKQETAPEREQKMLEAYLGVIQKGKWSCLSRAFVHRMQKK